MSVEPGPPHGLSKRVALEQAAVECVGEGQPGDVIDSPTGHDHRLDSIPEQLSGDRAGHSVRLPQVGAPVSRNDPSRPR